MTPEAWFVVITIALVVATMVTNRIGVDTAMMGGLMVLLVGDVVFGGGILDVHQGISGFANPAIFLVGSLFVVAAGLQETGGMEAVATRLLGRPKSEARAQLRMMIPVAGMSAFMNNTPIVAMYLPIVNDWAKKLRLSPSKLYMPLSFAAILGGKCTLIGTASNIVIMGMYVQYVGVADLPESITLSSSKQFWGVAALGVPTTIVGILTITVLARWLLPARRAATDVSTDARKYHLNMTIEDNSPIIGKSVEDAGLRSLPGLYLTQIQRGEQVLSAVSPQEILKARDQLVFVGILESVIDLRKIRGLVPSARQAEKVAAPRHLRTLVEAVVSRNSPLVGKSVRIAAFRTKYNAAIIAVHRNGEHVAGKIGDIMLQPGDTLLLDTHNGFVGAYRNSDDFYLVSNVEDSRPIRHERSGVALGILALFVGLLTLNIQPVVVALLCAGLMVLTRCVTGTEARRSVNWQVLLVIGAALGMGASLEQTGASAAIAHTIMEVCDGWGPHVLLAVLFFISCGFSQLINSNGAAVLMFPITVAAAAEYGLSPEPFVFSLMIAAGSTFISPVAYQTNLMVYGAGGYKFTDYALLGLPLTILVGALTVILAPIIFPFTFC
jgi:di/tricarboxylate transporter